MKTLYEVIKRPIVSEKSTMLANVGNRYVFEVDRNANKLRIKQAVEKLFKVRVKNVWTMVMHGKQKTFKRTVFKRPNWKKAIVALVQGQKIDLFPGVKQESEKKS